MADHRDWNTVSWDKRGERAKGESKKALVNRAMRSGIATSESRYGGSKNASGSSGVSAGTMSARKLEEEEETFKHAKVSLKLSRRIQMARTDKKMSQKELAQKLCVQANVISAYESGKAIPNHIIINKLERALGVRLRDPKGGKGGKAGAKKTTTTKKR